MSDSTETLVLDRPTSASRRAGRRAGRSVLRLLSWSWLLIALLVVWEWRFRASPSLFVPPVSDIFSTMHSEFFSGSASELFTTEELRSHMSASMSRAGRAWLIAVAIGITAGVLLGTSKIVREFGYPMVRFGMSIPSTALLPVALTLFGITDDMNVFLIVFGSVWVILINTMDGVRDLDETAVLTARSLHLSRRRTFFQVLLPGASPQIMTGLRVSIGIALILMVVSELFVASEGIGFYIVVNQRLFVFDNVWAGVFLLGLVGIVANGLFALIESRVLRWHIMAREHQD